MDVGASVLTGLDAKDSSAKSKQIVDNCDKEVDVVVVGYGGAGVVTAITAHDAGAKVLVLEKAPFRGSGSTSIRMGVCASPKNVDDFDEIQRKGESEMISGGQSWMAGLSGREILPAELGGTPQMTWTEMIEKGWIKKGDTLEALNGTYMRCLWW